MKIILLYFIFSCKNTYIQTGPFIHNHLCTMRKPLENIILLMIDESEFVDVDYRDLDAKRT